MLADALAGNLPNPTALHYARISVHLGKPDMAAIFARRGLEQCSERAKSLRAELANILRELEVG